MSSAQQQGSAVGNGIATAGRVIADIRAVIATILGIAGIVLGIYLLNKAKKNTWLTAPMNVTESNCPTVQPPPGSSCAVSGNFTVPGSSTVIQVSNLGLDQGTAQVGSTVTIQYNSANPSTVRSVGVPQSTEKTIAYIIIGISVLIMALSWLWAFAANKSRLVAQGTTVLEGASLASRFL
jgi:uncharacterized membrane protein YuzA (DUF378 family)